MDASFVNVHYSLPCFSPGVSPPSAKTSKSSRCPRRYVFAGNWGWPVPHAAKAVDWVRAHHPFWNASGGVDHVLWWSGDQGYGRPAYLGGELLPLGTSVNFPPASSIVVVLQAAFRDSVSGLRCIARGL